MDLKTRKVENFVWVVMAGLGCLILGIQYFVEDLDFRQLWVIPFIVQVTALISLLEK